METNVKAIELKDLWRRYKSDGSDKAREQLVVAYSPLVKYVAGRMSSGLPAHVEEADLISYGLLGLINAIERFDPVAEGEARKLIRGVRFAESAGEAIEGADAVVLVTEWPEFAALDLTALAASMRGSLLVDGRNLYDPAAVRAAGLVYEGIGRGGQG